MPDWRDPEAYAYAEGALRTKSTVILVGLRGRGFAIRAQHLDSLLLRRPQQLSGKLDLQRTMAVGEKAKVPYAHETVGQNMEEESTDELFATAYLDDATEACGPATSFVITP